MVLFYFTHAILAANSGGFVDVTYKVADNVDASTICNRSVFSSVLDYDIAGNHSARTPLHSRLLQALTLRSIRSGTAKQHAAGEGARKTN